MAFDSYFTGIILIIISIVLAVAGSILVRKTARTDSLRKSHEVGGYMLSVVGTMYAVLLGLVVVDAMSHFQEGIKLTEQEANSLADVFLLAERMPEPTGREVQELCRHYAERVINVEWGMMNTQCICPDARKTVINLVKKVRDWEPESESQKAIYPLALSQACQLWDCRRARTNLSGKSIPALEWWILITGGIVTILFTYFFEQENLKIQIAMTTLVSMIISLNLFLVLMFGYPFSGELKVSPEAFNLDLKIFDDQLGELKNKRPI